MRRERVYRSRDAYDRHSRVMLANGWRIVDHSVSAAPAGCMAQLLTFGLAGMLTRPKVAVRVVYERGD